MVCGTQRPWIVGLSYDGSPLPMRYLYQNSVHEVRRRVVVVSLQSIVHLHNFTPWGMSVIIRSLIIVPDKLLDML